MEGGRGRIVPEPAERSREDEVVGFGEEDSRRGERV